MPDVYTCDFDCMDSTEMDPYGAPYPRATHRPHDWDPRGYEYTYGPNDPGEEQ